MPLTKEEADEERAERIREQRREPVEPLVPVNVLGTWVGCEPPPVDIVQLLADLTAAVRAA